MNKLSENSRQRKDLLKHMILQLHAGEAPDAVRKRLIELLKSIPYDDVVEVEQELISEGLPVEEVLKFCDIHTMVLEGHIDQSGAAVIPPGHPVDTFKKENIELARLVAEIRLLADKSANLRNEDVGQWLLDVRTKLNNLMDIDKHYRKKEYLVFPYLEKKGITGPPKVMWGKHDEIRAQIKAAIEGVSAEGEITPEDARSFSDLLLRVVITSVPDMIMKEEEILFPMCMDTLSDEEWYSVYQQTMEIGYCLYDPKDEWRPEGITASAPVFAGNSNIIRMSSGSFAPEELESLFRILPVDITFVDKDDKVKFFSMGEGRIFTRSRAILGRDVRMCHPPASVHVVEKILNDFKSGKENRAAFWINMRGRFIYIEYYALRDNQGNYLGTLESTQDLTELKKLEGEQRLLSYMK